MTLLKKITLSVLLLAILSSVSLAENFTDKEKEKIKIALKYFPTEVSGHKNLDQLSTAEQSQLKTLLKNMPEDNIQFKKLASALPTSIINDLDPLQKKALLYLQSKYFIALSIGPKMFDFHRIETWDDLDLH